MPLDNEKGTWFAELKDVKIVWLGLMKVFVGRSVSTNKFGLQML
jgi:hypothetical protein